MLGLWLDLMTLKVFSNLNDSMIHHLEKGHCCSRVSLALTARLFTIVVLIYIIAINSPQLQL